jgi:Ni/Co efflux regulator RcnB
MAKVEHGLQTDPMPGFRLISAFRESSRGPDHDRRKMKRLILMIAAVASVAAATPLAAPAFARDGDQGRRAERQDRGRGTSADRGGGRRYDGDRGGRRGGDEGDERAGRRYDDDRSARRGGDERGARRDDRGPRRYDDGRRERVPALGYGDDRGPRRYDDGRRERVPALGSGDDRRGRREDYDDRRHEARPRSDAGPPRGFAPPPSARRGGYLPDSYRGGVVNDYRRYRLRPPPAGYSWVRIGNGFALVSEDGRIFDMVQ